MTANGALDPTFDGDGLLALTSAECDEAFAVAIQPDGSIVAAGYVVPADGTRRCRAAAGQWDGSLDNSFGTAGMAVVDLGDAVF